MIKFTWITHFILLWKWVLSINLFIFTVVATTLFIVMSKIGLLYICCTNIYKYQHEILVSISKPLNDLLDFCLFQTPNPREWKRFISSQAKVEENMAFFRSFLFGELHIHSFPSSSQIKEFLSRDVFSHALELERGKILRKT